MYWYANQTMCVRWSGIVSQGFHVTNGVRQGGILSPYLFNVYLDDLGIALSACRTGCCVGNSLINHLMQARNQGGSGGSRTPHKYEPPPPPPASSKLNSISDDLRKRHIYVPLKR